MSIPPPVLPTSGSALPPGVRRVIAVGGGRPGVGHSIMAVNLAVYLAQLGRKVVLVDSDPCGATLHTMLDVEATPPTDPPDHLADEELVPLPTPVPGLALLPQLYSIGSTVPNRPGRKPRWARGLRQLDADYIILDLGPGTAPATLDLFLDADLGVCVTSPEPPSVEATYRLVRALFLRRVRRMLIKDRFKLRMVERALAELQPLPSPVELVRAAARYDSGISQQAALELARLRPRLVVNGTRLRQDNELGLAMVDMAARYLGCNLDYVGHVEQDDAVWLSVVRRRPLLIDGNTSKSARNLERIARRVLALATSREQPREAQPISATAHEPTLYEVLWTHRGATDEDLRRACKRQRDIYQPGSLPITSLLGDAELARERARVEEAHDTLLDPVRRRAYDLSTFPDAADTAHDTRPRDDGAVLAERAMLREELAREIHAETEFTGRLLQRVRESQGIEIEDIARQTKIASAHVRSIEAEEFGKLPAQVYTRGFVQQLAKLLGLDPTQVTRTYLRRMRHWQKSQDAASG